MEFLVEKIGMSRTVSVPSVAVTLLKVKDTKVCQKLESGKALVSYAQGKKANKAIEGQQKKYELDKMYNRFATIEVGDAEVGELNTETLNEAKRVKVSLNTKGRGFTGVMKRWNFAGGPESHGSRFHRRVGSIGNCEWPGRVMPGRKMSGQYGDELVTVQNEVVSFDKENGILVLKGSIPGRNGAFGKIRIVK